MSVKERIILNSRIALNHKKNRPQIDFNFQPQLIIHPVSGCFYFYRVAFY